MRTSARITGAAAAAALLMSGCGSSSDEGGKGGPESPGASDTAKPEGGDEGGQVDAEALNGGWATSTTKPDDMLILAFAKNKVMLTGVKSCSGDAAVGDNPVTLDLKCQDGSTDYAKGTVKKADDKKLTVAWDSGRSTTFNKATDANGDPKELPGGMPSDMPTKMPEGMPTDPSELGN